MKDNIKHTKHTALAKPLGGEYHSNEWALLGATCDIINQYAKDIALTLSKQRKVGYIDASHQEVIKDHPFAVYYHDQQAFAQIDTYESFAQKQNKKHFASLDLLLINGNHFIGDKQIVFITEKKKESLKRKLDRITDLRIVIVEDESQEIHDFIKPLMTEQVKVYTLKEIEKVVRHIEIDSNTYIPVLHGLVLAGGKSLRMGKDKGLLDYHGKPQREYQADMLNDICANVFLSLHQSQINQTLDNYPIIKDTFTDLGPYGAILSAFRAYPNHAWLTIACDLPLLDTESLNHLIKERDPSKLATCFHNPDTNFPEPLITIWEPRAYPVLLSFLSQGYSCPRKVLINTDIKEIHIDKVAFMKNVNDLESYSQLKKEIKRLS